MKEILLLHNNFFLMITPHMAGKKENCVSRNRFCLLFINIIIRCGESVDGRKKSIFLCCLICCLDSLKGMILTEEWRRQIKLWIFLLSTNSPHARLWCLYLTKPVFVFKSAIIWKIKIYLIFKTFTYSNVDLNSFGLDHLS